MPHEEAWLNIDMGELADEPDELYAIAHGVSIACGGHAGDDASMRRALAACARHGTRAGAHPSYPDREGFGRRATAMSPGAIEEEVAAQCARLAALGATLAHVKPHGALYHEACANDAVARAVVGAAARTLGPVTIVGRASSALHRAATSAGLAFAREGFADRLTRPDGTLVPRGEPGALVTDPAAAAARARELASSVDTICVHGDTLGAVAIARAVRAALDAGRG